jgi:lipid A disaccharide synthetase
LLADANLSGVARYPQIADIASQSRENWRPAVTQQRKDFQSAVADNDRALKRLPRSREKEIQVLRASLTEQAAQIRKVGAQLEVSKAAPKTGPASAELAVIR